MREGILRFPRDFNVCRKLAARLHVQTIIEMVNSYCIPFERGVKPSLPPT